MFWDWVSSLLLSIETQSLMWAECLVAVCPEVDAERAFRLWCHTSPWFQNLVSKQESLGSSTLFYLYLVFKYMQPVKIEDVPVSSCVYTSCLAIGCLLLLLWCVRQSLPWWSSMLATFGCTQSSDFTQGSWWWRYVSFHLYHWRSSLPQTCRCPWF